MKMRLDGSGFGFSSKRNEGIMGRSEMKVDDIGGGGTLNTGDFEGFADEAGEAQGGIVRGVFLVIGTFVGFVDDNETKIADGGEKGRTGTNDHLRERLAFICFGELFIRGPVVAPSRRRGCRATCVLGRNLRKLL